MKQPISTYLGIAGGLVLAANASAEIINVPGGQPTIQAGIAAANPGDVVIVSPEATIRRGDRVIVKTIDGEIMAKEIVRHTKRQLELRSVNSDHPDPMVATQDVAWMHRIVWASQ